MERDVTPKLSAAEVGFLWSHFMGNSMNIVMLKHFLTYVEDREDEMVLRYGLEAAVRIDAAIPAILTKEGFPRPKGFSDEDLDQGAPRLFTDAGSLYYVKRMVQLAMPAAAQGLVSSQRADVRDFFSMSARLGEELDNRVTHVLLAKGLMIRPPLLPIQKEMKTAGKDLMGNLLGKHRPLLSIEIAHIFVNLMNNVFGNHVVAGFSQVARAKELREYFFRGMEIANKHLKVFADTLNDSGLKSPMTWDAMPTLSTTPPFSDRFMLSLVTSVTAMGLGHYGLALAASMRPDLAAMYVRLIAEVGMYLADGTALLIRNRWLEEPPGAPDRAALALSGR